MSGYLDHYGAGEERRNQIIFRSILAIVLLVIVGSLAWYIFLNHHEEGIAKSFIAAIDRGDTQTAYRVWGCAAPCSGYEYDRFLKDWGPGPNGPDPAVMSLTDSEECNNGVMLTLQVNRNRVEQLWVDRGGDAMSFAPYLFCPQQIPYEIMAHRTLGKLRKIFLK